MSEQEAKAAAEAAEQAIPLFFQDSAMGLLLRIGIIFVATFLVVQLYRSLWKSWNKNKEISIQQRFFYNIVTILIYFVGIVIAIVQLPKGGTVLSSLLAGSGFAALAIGLAAQESLGNLVNGIVLTIAKPFEVGDRIHLVNGKITGYVEDITLRHTIMRTFVNSRIIIPNSTINKDMIENSNYQIGRASSFIDLTVTFDSDLDLAREIVARVIGEHPQFLDTRTPENSDQPKVKVFVRELTINGIALRASMWTSSVDDNFEACSDARYGIKKEFDRVGILLAQVPARPMGFERAGVAVEVVEE